jgi:hypothetical protein
MSRASDSGAFAALIIGDDELSQQRVQFKNLRTGEQSLLTFEETLEPLMELTADRAWAAVTAEVSELQGMPRLPEIKQE